MSKLIYIADDEENIRNIIKSFLEKDGFKVKAFEDGSDLLDEFYNKPSDLVILDSMMPKMDGLSVCALLRKLTTVPIIMVSALGSELDKVTAIKLGCDDYITKPFSPLELIARVQSIFRRIDLDRGTLTNHISKPSTLTFGDLNIDENKLLVSICDNPINFTQNEFSLIVYLIKNVDRAVSRQELLQKVWKYSFNDIDTRATDDTIKRLRKKLVEYNSSVKIETVRGYGFRIHEDEA